MTATNIPVGVIIAQGCVIRSVRAMNSFERILSCWKDRLRAIAAEACRRGFIAAARAIGKAH